MRRLLHAAGRWAPAVFALCSIYWAVERWLWYRSLPRFADARICGNCFLASVGVPTEIALLVLLVWARSFLRIRPVRTDVLYWCAAIMGVILDTVGIGTLLFAYGFGGLAWAICRSLTRAAPHP